MFVVLSYDVNAKRTAKLMKICNRYLIHRHASVFEGVISEHNLNLLKQELEAKVNVEEDSVVLYEFQSTKYASREYIGTKGAWNHAVCL